MLDSHHHLVLVLVLQTEVISFNQIEVSTDHLEQNLARCSLLRINRKAQEHLFLLLD